MARGLKGYKLLFRAGAKRVKSGHMIASARAGARAGGNKLKIVRKKGMYNFYLK